MAQFMYKYEDSHNSKDDVMRHLMLSLLINPISLAGLEALHFTFNSILRGLNQQFSIVYELLSLNLK
ncbi:hypothetical protein SLA2020_241200 [Shorea laevis]